MIKQNKLSLTKKLDGGYLHVKKSPNKLQVKKGGYSDYLHKQTAGNKPSSNKLGWIGNLNTHISRKKLYQIGQENKSIMDIISMEWIKSENQKISTLLDATYYISMIDLVSKYKYLLDIRGHGDYSARLKILLWSHRPLLIVKRYGKEWIIKSSCY